MLLARTSLLQAQHRVRYVLLALIYHILDGQIVSHVLLAHSLQVHPLEAHLSLRVPSVPLDIQEL